MRTRWLPVVGVLVLAPWFAELLWGGFPYTLVPAVLLFLAPVYGAGALLVREVARRSGGGWPTILLLGAAFGVVQAGIVDQSLFNPAYGRFDFQHPAHVDGIDVSLYFLVAFVTGHVVASIAAPVLVVESWSRRSAEPWLSRRTTWVLGVVWVLGSVVNHVGVKEDEGHGFQAEPVQTLAAAVVALLLVVVALRRRARPATSSWVPRPWVLGVVGLVGYLLYLPGEGTPAVVVGLVVIGLAVVVLGTWSRSTRWSRDHTVALGLGTVLVGLVSPYWNDPYDDSVSTARELVDDSVAAGICLVIVLVTVWRLRAIGGDRGGSVGPAVRPEPVGPDRDVARARPGTQDVHEC